MKNTVLTKNGTVGTIDSDTIDGQDINGFIGEMVTVHLYDENGNALEVTDILAEVLD